jgi:hypothetical protein
MGSYRSPAHAGDAELLRLERAARTRRITSAEDARLAELSFRAHRRGTRLRFAANSTRKHEA